ncbi:MAG: TrkA-C domain protein [Halorubrum sp. J07HR59]|nr:MAG: TrkA-C domain protein [Halorubrum sp. J07HR59]
MIAIEREEDVITDIGPDTEINVDDIIQVVGADSGIRSFEQLFT